MQVNFQPLDLNELIKPFNILYTLYHLLGKSIETFPAILSTSSVMYLSLSLSLSLFSSHLPRMEIEVAGCARIEEAP
ncbi:hypothetical protein ACSBR2_016032 [Camellia fascicularis]